MWFSLILYYYYFIRFGGFFSLSFWAVIFFVRHFYRFRIPLNACARTNQSTEFLNDSLLLLLLLVLFNGLPEKLQSKHVSLFVFGVHLSKSLSINFHSHSFPFYECSNHSKKERNFLFFWLIECLDWMSCSNCSMIQQHYMWIMFWGIHSPFYSFIYYYFFGWSECVEFTKHLHCVIALFFTHIFRDWIIFRERMWMYSVSTKPFKL